MRRSDRQLAMLREMGIRVWLRDSAPGEGTAPAGADAAVMEEARERASAPVAPALAGADWLIVGEPVDASGSPGDPSPARDQERLLDNMLRAIRVTRQAPGRTGRACHLAIGGRQPVDLDDAIARVAPRCILALGRAAASALLGTDEPLGRLREHVHERGGIPVVVTFALPFLLRHPADKAKAWADLCRAVGALGPVSKP